MEWNWMEWLMFGVFLMESDSGEYFSKKNENIRELEDEKKLMNWIIPVWKLIKLNEKKSFSCKLFIEMRIAEERYFCVYVKTSQMHYHNRHTKFNCTFLR